MLGESLEGAQSSGAEEVDQDVLHDLYDGCSGLQPSNQVAKSSVNPWRNPLRGAPPLRVSRPEYGAQVCMETR
jgi:hypothetical protein